VTSGEARHERLDRGRKTGENAARKTKGEQIVEDRSPEVVT
jgi:hypothetical protein